MSEANLKDVLARHGDMIVYCIAIADKNLRRCNAVLHRLQPKQPGRITLLEEEVTGDRKIVLSRLRWRVVRWRIHRTYSDGSVVWRAEHLKARGAGRRAAMRFGFRDTAPEVREVLAFAARLMEWRASLMQAAARFVTAADAQFAQGLPAMAKRRKDVAEALERGNARQAENRALVAEIVARQKQFRKDPGEP